MTRKSRQTSAFPPDMVIYQIYPRSFLDADGNGTGDLAGIRRKLPYLSDLGVTAIWISPFFASPMLDGGYDVSDHCAVDPMFGTMKDFDQLIAEAHSRNIKVILDLVVNHTSEDHPWFKESKKSPATPKRDWYIWRNPRRGGKAPNNWLSAFSGPAWEYDQATGQYYLHSFAKQQPDLNWRNPEVRQAIKNIMRFWLDKGVDGFRADAVYWLSKDHKFRDDPRNYRFDQHKQLPYDALLHAHSKRGAKLYAYLKELSEVAKSYRNRIIITEAYPHRRFGYNSYLRFYKKTDPKVLAPFNFEGIFLAWKATDFQKYIDGFQGRLRPGYVPIYALGNHDKPRIASRLGQKSARAAALILLSLPGVPVVYYGDELGMEDVPIPKTKEHDEVGHGADGNRDSQRTPMQWADSARAGFTSGTPWLPIGRDYRTRNVEHELGDPNSLLNLYKKLLGFRKGSEALKNGVYKPTRLKHKDLFSFMRITKQEKLLIVANFSKTESITYGLKGQTLLSTHHNPTDQPTLKPLEARIIAL